MSDFGHKKCGQLTDVDQIHRNPSIEQEKITSESRLKTSTDHFAKHGRSEGSSKDEGLKVQPEEPLQGLPQKNNAETATPGDEEAPESDRAHFDRLGRERPAKFKSFGAELAFCYSVIASQFMTVRHLATTPFNPDH